MVTFAEPTAVREFLLPSSVNHSRSEVASLPRGAPQHLHPQPIRTAGRHGCVVEVHQKGCVTRRGRLYARRKRRRATPAANAERLGMAITAADAAGFRRSLRAHPSDHERCLLTHWT